MQRSVRHNRPRAQAPPVIPHPTLLSILQPVPTHKDISVVPVVVLAAVAAGTECGLPDVHSVMETLALGLKLLPAAEWGWICDN